MWIIGFIYPLDILEQEQSKKIVCLEQQNSSSTKLFLIDLQTNEREYVLPALFSPGGVKLIPQNNGISFIDKGLIRFKEFTQSAPKTIEFYEPIFDVSVLMQWLDSESFYFSAHQQCHNGIYIANKKGDLVTVLYDNVADYLYPQIIEETLFFIERVEKNYLLKSISLKNQEFPLSDADAALLFDFNSEPHIFLKMVTAEHGFCLSYAEPIISTHHMLSCTYHELWCENKKWQRKVLFNFDIPLMFLISESPWRLYESILPLLPIHRADVIYFSHGCSTTVASYCKHHHEECQIKQPTLNLYAYSSLSGVITQITNASQGEAFFSPIVYEGTLFYGGGPELLRVEL